MRKATKARQKCSSLEFLDKDNYSVKFRSGVFTMQHFHSRDDLQGLLERYFHNVEVYKYGHSTLSAKCSNPKQLDVGEYEKALDTEFNMEYPGEYKHNRHLDLKREIMNHVNARTVN